MFDKQLLRLDGMKPLLTVLAGFSFLQALLIAGQAMALARGLTLLWQGGGLTAAWPWILLFGLAFLSREGLNLTREARLERYGRKTATALRERYVRALYKVGPALLSEEGSGPLISGAIEGMAHIENYLRLLPLKMTDLAVIPVLLLPLLFICDWVSGLILLLVTPLSVLFMILFGHAARSRADRQFEGYNLLAGHFLDSLRGIATLRLFGRSRDHAKTVFSVSEAYRKASLATLKIATLSTFALDFFTTLSIAIVAVFLGLRLINGAMTLLPALTILVLAPDFFQPLRQFAGDYHATLDGKNALRATLTLLERAEAQAAGTAAASSCSSETRSNDARETAAAAKSPVPLLSYQDSSVLTLELDNWRYSDRQTDALHNLDLHFTGCEKVALIGQSGAGKSTLLNLIGGFARSENAAFTLKLDGRPFNPAEPDWQRNLIYIPQQPYLFHATLAENVAFYRPDANDGEILAALEQAGLGALPKQLPDGLRTMLGEGGRRLSGGEAQRLALARAFLIPERRILLLDEPTAHLDLEMELAIKPCILRLAEGRLALFATHRLHWLPDMDRTLMLQDGTLAGEGDYRRLYAENKAFASLVACLRGEGADV